MKAMTNSIVAVKNLNFRLMLIKSIYLMKKDKSIHFRKDGLTNLSLKKNHQSKLIYKDKLFMITILSSITIA